MGWEGQKKEIHIAGNWKGGQMSKSAKMKLIGIRWIPPVAILWMLEEGPEIARRADRVGVLPHAPLVRKRAETTIWDMFNSPPPAHCAPVTFALQWVQWWFYEGRIVQNKKNSLGQRAWWFGNASNLVCIFFPKNSPYFHAPVKNYGYFSETGWSNQISISENLKEVIRSNGASTLDPN